MLGELISYRRGWGSCHKAAATLAVVSVVISASLCVGQQPTATAVITDRANLTAINEFSIVNQWRLAGTGDVFFTSGNNTALFRWEQGSGIRVRLLQTNQEHPPVSGEALPGNLIDTVGANLQTNVAGHIAMIDSIAMPAERDPVGIVLYDGIAYDLVAGRGQDIPGTEREFAGFGQLFLNDNDAVAFIGSTEPSGMGLTGVFLKRPGEELVKIALQQEEAPIVGGTMTALSLIGLNNAGQVAFVANISGGATNRAVFLSDGSNVSLVVSNGEAADGTGGFFNNLPASGGYYMLNVHGQIAFQSSTSVGISGIWVDTDAAPAVKLALQGEPTGIAGWGNYAYPLTLRGFNDSGQVLFDSNITSDGTSPSHALFLKDLDPATTQVVVFRGQDGGPNGESFDTVMQAALNNNGNVAFLARSSAWAVGWYFASFMAGSEMAELAPIAIQWAPTPAGGQFGLAGRNTAAQLNNEDQVLFVADILERNAVGLFFWEAGLARSVVSTMDSLPAGAQTVLRSAYVANDQEALVAIRRAGGKASIYANSSRPGMGKLRRIVGDLDPAPTGGVFLVPAGFAINARSEIVFHSGLLGPSSGAYPATGLFASVPSEAELVTIVESLDSAPGGAPDERFTVSFTQPQINNYPQAAFWANTTHGSGIFVATEGAGLEKLVHSGDPWPTGGGDISTVSSSFSFNDHGQVAFQAFRPGGTGVFVATLEDPALKVVELGDPAPIGTFTNISAPFKINAGGKVAFTAAYSSNSGIFLGEGGMTPQVIVQTGSPAPGADAGATFITFNASTMDLNNSGQVAFWAGLSGPTVLSGWYLGSAGSEPLPRLLHGQLLPGGGKAGVLPPASRAAALANSGEMAFHVPNIENAENLSRLVIAGVDGTLRKFAATGEPAEGTGSKFGKLYPLLTVTPSGRFLFGAVLLEGPAKAGVFQNGTAKR